MLVTITYKLKNGTVKSKDFIRDDVNTALKFFEWRYGHPVLSMVVDGKQSIDSAA